MAGGMKAQTLSAAEFEKLVPGESDYETVLKILGKPLWEYTYLAEKDTIPVQLPESYGPPSVRRRPRDRSKLEILRVMRYPGDDQREFYATVMRYGKLYYTIGPVPPDKRTPEAVEARYGTPVIRLDKTFHAHILRSVEVVTYEERGIGFLREGGKGDYTGKLRMAPKPKSKAKPQ